PQTKEPRDTRRRGKKVSKKQPTVDLDEDDDDDVEEKRANTRWTRTEDILLTESWVEHSQNANIEKDQPDDVFWNLIMQAFNTRTKSAPRTTGKWSRINGDCQKFNAIYKNLTRKSRKNKADHIENANDTYMERYGNKKFQYVHSWNILKSYPKWDATKPLMKIILLSYLGLIRELDNRRKCEAAEDAYEAKRKKELRLLECRELEFLMIDRSSLPPEKAAYIQRKQAEIIKKISKRSICLSVVKDVFKDHFATRFKKPAHGRLKLNISFSNRLSTDQVADMDPSVSRNEIRVAVWNCGENKSPGPDGYTFEFFRRYWRFIGSDLCSAVECFFESGSFPKGSNSSFIALISKVTDAKFVIDFRPISLIGCVYKVVTKILANRLATVISDLVSDIQSAFVANRQILDGSFILNELLAWCKRKKKQAMIFKVDLLRRVMVGDSMSRKLAWAHTVQKLRSWLSKWKVKTLSIGGRLTILKSVLGASFLYNMSIYKVPKGVLKEMEAIRCNFFNGADPAERKIT
nr:RNA-directed DNA polymerase, eukaryota, reverse transcriptase zinc-binding domain protein [Tanacetum cinerariifolium]